MTPGLAQYGVTVVLCVFSAVFPFPWSSSPVFDVLTSLIHLTTHANSCLLDSKLLEVVSVSVMFTTVGLAPSTNPDT